MATIFGPKLGPSSGHNNKEIEYTQELKIIQQDISPFTSR
jgi:hypothetical protein